MKSHLMMFITSILFFIIDLFFIAIFSNFFISSLLCYVAGLLFFTNRNIIKNHSAFSLYALVIFQYSLCYYTVVSTIKLIALFFLLITFRNNIAYPSLINTIMYLCYLLLFYSLLFFRYFCCTNIYLLFFSVILGLYGVVLTKKFTLKNKLYEYM